MSCGGSSGALESRFVAVHNAMTAMGLAQTGPISEGTLPEGADARIPIELRGGECATIVALGSSQVQNLDVRVVDEQGAEIARDTTIDRQSAAQVCPEESGEHTVIVHMQAGQGGYTVSSWSGSVRAGTTAARGAAGGAGACASPIALELGTPVHGNTQTGTSTMQGSCVNNTAPEQVYRIEVPRRAQLNAVLQSGYDGALYLLRTCGERASELACNDDSPDTTRSELDATLEPGTYFLVVDGYGEESGEYDLIASLTELQSLQAVCGDAATLPVGQLVSGSTQGAANYFQATCAGGARSPDRVYQLEVPARSRVRVRQQSDHDGALYLRTDCQDPTSEVACNDDHRDQQHSVVAAIVNPGRYYVYTDGFSSGNAGNYGLQADLTPEPAGGGDADACGAPGSATSGQPLSVDTFEARDDYSGSCGGQGGPDVVYRLVVRNRSRLRAQLTSAEHSAVMYLQSTCGTSASELGCVSMANTALSQPAPGPGPAGPPPVPTLEAVVQPGTYFLVVDGDRADAFGAAEIDLQLDDLVALERTCRSAPLLRPGRPVSGDTRGGSDRFQASCAGGTRSNDVVYRLRLTRRQQVRISMSSDYDGALHLRTDCVTAASEIECNDDSTDNRNSRIERTLDPGTYFVVVDGFSAGNEGTFTLDVETSNP